VCSFTKKTFWDRISFIDGFFRLVGRWVGRE
jgi:hypothetical protein